MEATQDIRDKGVLPQERGCVRISGITKSSLMMTPETFMIEELSKEMVLLLVEEHGMKLEDALRALYTSDTYARLTDLHTGLYAQSTAYVYEYLEHELSTGRMA